MFYMLVGKKNSGKTRFIKMHLFTHVYDFIYVVYLADIENRYTEYINCCDSILLKLPHFMYLDNSFHENSRCRRRCIIFENFFFLNIKKELYNDIIKLLTFLKQEQNIDVFIVMREIYNSIPDSIMKLADLIKFM